MVSFAGHIQSMSLSNIFSRKLRTKILLSIKSYKSSRKFSKSMTRTFTNNDVFKNGKMHLLKKYQLGHARLASGPQDYTLNDTNFCLNIPPPTKLDVDAIMNQTNCLICCIPLSHADSHYMV